VEGIEWLKAHALRVCFDTPVLYRTGVGAEWGNISWGAGRRLGRRAITVVPLCGAVRTSSAPSNWAARSGYHGRPLVWSGAHLQRTVQLGGTLSHAKQAIVPLARELAGLIGHLKANAVVRDRKEQLVAHAPHAYDHLPGVGVL